MAGLGVQGMTHWSIPVNNLDEAEEFYGGLLGLEHKGRLGNNSMSCYSTGDTNHPALRAEDAGQRLASGRPPLLHRYA